MKIRLFLPFLLALGACDGASSGGSAYKFEPFAGWSAFKEGSSVEFDMEAGGQKMKQSKTLEKKTADEITLKTEMIMMIGDKETKMPRPETIKKGAAVEGNCPACSKPFKDHKDETKRSSETLKIDGKDVACTVVEGPAKNCKGEDAPKMKMWYSLDVPGHLVKTEMAAMKMTLLKFEAKK